MDSIVASRASMATQCNCSEFTLGGRPAPSLANNPFCHDRANVATYPNTARIETLKNWGASETGISSRNVLTPWILFHGCSIGCQVKNRSLKKFILALLAKLIDNVLGGKNCLVDHELTRPQPSQLHQFNWFGSKLIFVNAG